MFLQLLESFVFPFELLIEIRRFINLDNLSEKSLGVSPTYSSIIKVETQ